MIMIIFRALCVVYTLSKSKYDSLFHHWLVWSTLNESQKQKYICLLSNG